MVVVLLFVDQYSSSDDRFFSDRMIKKNNAHHVLDASYRSTIAIDNNIVDNILYWINIDMAHHRQPRG